MTNKVKITIREMHGSYAAAGVFLEDGNNALCPKLLPGEVVEVPDNHPVFRSPSAGCVMVTDAEATRPYEFEDSMQAFTRGGQRVGDDVAAAHASIDESRRLADETREKELARLQAENQDTTGALTKANIEIAELKRTLAAQQSADAAAGLGAVRDDNAVPRGNEPEPPTTEAPPPAKGRRGGRRGR